MVSLAEAAVAGDARRLAVVIASSMATVAAALAWVGVRVLVVVIGLMGSSFSAGRNLATNTVLPLSSFSAKFLASNTVFFLGREESGYKHCSTTNPRGGDTTINIPSFKHCLLSRQNSLLQTLSSFSAGRNLATNTCIEALIRLLQSLQVRQAHVVQELASSSGVGPSPHREPDNQLPPHAAKNPNVFTCPRMPPRTPTSSP